MSSEHEVATPGRLYRVGRDWYVDSALLQRIAGRLVVEPMQGGFQILAPAGLMRCIPAHGLALPGQSGALYRCQGQRPDQDVGARLRNLAGGLGEGAMGGEWEEWPSAAADAEPPHTSCGCHGCRAGGSCGDEDKPSEYPGASLAERLIVSETLGTVSVRALAEAYVAVFPSENGGPEWACGRYHECIGSMLRFPDVAASEWLARVSFKSGRADITWGVVLDRQRRLMLGEILELVARQLGKASRSGSVRPSLPPPSTPGFGAWEMAAEYGARQSACDLCPYRLGTNLRCRTCRRFLISRPRKPSSDQAKAVTKVLAEQTDLRTLPAETLKTLGTAIATSHAKNSHEPFTDAFFVRLERDVLIAAGAQRLSESMIAGLLETAELTPFEPEVIVGAVARSAA